MILHSRPTHSKTKNSRSPWFWALEMVVLFKFLEIYNTKLIEIDLKIAKSNRDFRLLSSVLVGFN